MAHTFTTLTKRNERTTARLSTFAELQELVAGAWPGRNNKQRTPVGLAYMAADAVLQARGGDELPRAFTEFKRCKADLPALIPGAVWPGTDGVHDTSKGKAHTLAGYMVLDFDHPDKNKPEQGVPLDVVAITAWVDAIMAKAKASPHTLVAYRSPSRTGVKVLVALGGCPTNVALVGGDVDKGDALHVRRSFYATYAAAAALLDLGDDVAIDAGAKEPERLTYLAHDAHAYFNADAVPVPWVEAASANGAAPANGAVAITAPADVVNIASARKIELAMARGMTLDMVVSRVVEWYRQHYPLEPGAKNDNAFAWACGLVRNAVPDDIITDVLRHELGPNDLGKLHIYARDAHKYVATGSDPWAWSKSKPSKVGRDLNAMAAAIAGHDVQAREVAQVPPAPQLRRWTVDELRSAARNYPRPVLTGINRLDISLGIRPGGVVLIGAEPGAGKSMFLVNLMLSMARRNPAHSFVFYSAEMPAHECAARMVQALAPDPHEMAVKLRAGGLAYLNHDNELEGVALDHLLAKGIEDERGHLVRNNGELLNEMHRRAAERGLELGDVFTGPSFRHLVEGQRLFDELYDAGRILIVDDERQLIKLTDLRADLETATPLDLGAVFVDYATRIEGDDNDGKEMRHAVVDTSKQLTAITKARQVPLFLASQIGRDAFKRDAAGGVKAQRDRELKAERPRSHFEALEMREMAVADGDVFAESAQWYRDADVTIVLHNPAQGANRAPRERLDAYTDGVTPFFARVGKVRGGAAVHDVVELGAELHRQRIVSDCPLPMSAKYTMGVARWWTFDEQEAHMAANEGDADTDKPRTTTRRAPLKVSTEPMK